METIKENNMTIYTAAIITISDSCFKGERVDTAGPEVERMIQEVGFEVIYTSIVPDDIDKIQNEVLKCADELKISLILTCGGTGFSKRDVTPEAVEVLFDRKAPGFGEAMRMESYKITPKAVLSRAVSGLRKDSIIITLPGSLKSASENLKAILPALKHGVEMNLSIGSNNCGEKHDWFKYLAYRSKKRF